MVVVDSKVVARCSCKGCGLGNSSLIVVVVVVGVVGNRFVVGLGNRWQDEMGRSSGKK